MNNKTLFSFAMAGAALVPVGTDALEAHAAPPGSAVIHGAPLNDKAPVSGTPLKLRRTDEEQPGWEMANFCYDEVANKGLYFAASTELNGQPANRRIQGAMIPFTLAMTAGGALGGTIAPVADRTKGIFITNNNGNEYRQFNNSTCDIVELGGQKYAYVEYNYQPQNGDDTIRWAQAFTMDGLRVMDQTEVFAKQNDDCSMHQDGQRIAKMPVAGQPNRVRIGGYRGCNGNGRDDGWASVGLLEATSPTTLTFKRQFDVSVCPREERSRGAVRALADGSGMIVSWTEGNNQPQRDGVWLAAVKVDGTTQGENRQETLMWKEQIDGRVDQDGIRTYSMRMKMEQMLANDGTPDNRFLIQYGHLRGNNNTNGKGGTYYRSMTGVVKADLAGMTYEQPMTDIANTALRGLDGTHLGATFGMFGTEGSAVPGIVYLSGSHVGGGSKSQLRVVTFGDSTTPTGAGGPAGGLFKAQGTLAGAPFDHHLYPNYLGNNPGNQGRNHSHGRIIANPFAGQGHQATQLLVYATTAKDTGGAGGSVEDQRLSPEIKLAAWLTVTPVQAKATAPDPITPDPEDPSDPSNPEDPSNPDAPAELGGCSTGNSTGGIAGLLLLGLAFIRRRR